MSISERLARVVATHGGDAKALAREIGMPYRTLQDYVRGVRKPGADAIELICTRLRVSANWFLLGEGEMFRPDVANGNPRFGRMDGPASAVLETTKGGAAQKQEPYERASSAHRMAALSAMLDQLDPESREAIITEALSRASSKKRLDDLGQAIETMAIELRKLAS